MKYAITVFLAGLCIAFSLQSNAEEKIKMNFKDEDIIKLITQYAKTSGKSFIIDSQVKGKITLLNSDEVSPDEAYNQISVALALNGYAIVKQGNIFIVRYARAAIQNNVEVVTEVPAATPQRMITWITTLKNVAVTSESVTPLRLAGSSYGEIAVLPTTNQIIIADWSTVIPKIADIIKKIDIPDSIPKKTKLTKPTN